MGVTLFQPPMMPADELLREQGVEDAGALHATDDPTLQRLVEEARCRLGTAMAGISIIYRDWQYLIAGAGIPAGAYSRRTSLCGHAILRPGELLYVPDAQRDPRFADNPLVAEDRLLRFYLGVPLIDRTGTALGALCVFDPRPRPGLGQPQAAQLVSLADAVVARLAELRHGQPASAARAPA